MWDQKYDEIVRQNLPFLGAGEPLDDDTDLREFGLDSLGMVQLLSSLEGAYDIRFAEEALRLETFATAGSLWRAVSASLPSPAA